MDHLGVPTAGISKPALCQDRFRRQRRRAAADDLSHDGQHDDGNGTEGRKHAERRMQHVDNEQIKRDPRRVEKNGRPRSRKESAQLIEVPQRKYPVRISTGPERKKQRNRERSLLQTAVESTGDSDQQTKPHEIEQTVGRVEA